MNSTVVIFFLGSRSITGFPGSTSADEANPGSIRKSDNQIYCGSGIYIPVALYDNAKNCASRAKTRELGFCRFVKEIAVSIIGTSDLKMQSVTGKKTNNTKLGPREAKPKIDETKLAAVYGKK